MRALVLLARRFSRSLFARQSYVVQVEYRECLGKSFPHLAHEILILQLV